MGVGDIPVSKGLAVDTACNRGKPLQHIIVIGALAAHSGSMGCQQSGSQTVGIDLGIAIAAHLPGLGCHLVIGIVGLAGGEDIAIGILHRACHQAAQRIVRILVGKARFAVLHRIQLPVAGIAVGQDSAIGIGGGLDSAQIVIGKGHTVPVAVALAGQKAVIGAIVIGGKGNGGTYGDSLGVAETIVSKLIGLAAVSRSAGQGIQHSIIVSIAQRSQTCKGHVGHSAERIQSIGGLGALGIGDGACLAQHLIEIAAVGIACDISRAVCHGSCPVAVGGISGGGCDLLAGFAAESRSQHIAHAIVGEGLGGDAVGAAHHPMDEGGIVGIGGGDLVGTLAAGLLHHGFHIAVAIIGDGLLVQACPGLCLGPTGTTAPTYCQAYIKITGSICSP